MHLTVISLHTPTEENYRGASALPYHILANRPNSVNAVVYSFNLNRVDTGKIRLVEKQIGLTINILSWPKALSRIVGSSLAFKFFSIAAPLPYLTYLRYSRDLQAVYEQEADAIWIYGEELAAIARKFSGKPVVVTGPDSEQLYYRRWFNILGPESGMLQRFRKWVAGKKYLRLEKHLPADGNITYHVVGEKDRDNLKSVRPGIRVKFIRHPHYRCREREIKFHAPIRLLIAGQNNIYMHSSAVRIVRMLAAESSIVPHYSVTFLGRGWENENRQLKEAGYESRHIDFVDNYIDEISNHDIQLTPIVVGTGTKGKVLDAFANGLLVLGNELALENIAVKDGENCIEFSDMENLKTILKEIPSDVSRYEQMAESGRRKVLTLHSHIAVADQFFELF